MEREDIKFYQVLGIDVTKQDVLKLSDKEISSAYRKASLRWHPDKNPNDANAAKQFTLVCEAYEILSTANKRKFYDDRIRQVRHRREAFQRMDETRRKMRYQLQQRERKAIHHQQQNSHQQTQPSRQASASRMNTDADARIQKELAKLRKQALSEQQQQQDQHSPLHKQSDGNKRSSHTSRWADVPGFTAFRSQSGKVSFDDFERAVLEGRNPFGE